MSINSVNISGHLTRDAELRSAGQTAVLSFCVAVNDRRRNQQTQEWEDHANFVDCVLFGRRAESLAGRMTKGAKAMVSGRLSQSRWQAKDGSSRSKLEVIVDELELPGGSRPRQQETAAEDIPF